MAQNQIQHGLGTSLEVRRKVAACRTRLGDNEAGDLLQLVPRPHGSQGNNPVATLSSASLGRKLSGGAPGSCSPPIFHQRKGERGREKGKKIQEVLSRTLRGPKRI